MSVSFLFPPSGFEIETHAQTLVVSIDTDPGIVDLVVTCRPSEGPEVVFAAELVNVTIQAGSLNWTYELKLANLETGRIYALKAAWRDIRERHGTVTSSFKTQAAAAATSILPQAAGGLTITIPKANGTISAGHGFAYGQIGSLITAIKLVYDSTGDTINITPTVNDPDNYTWWSANFTVPNKQPLTYTLTVTDGSGDVTRNNLHVV